MTRKRKKNFDVLYDDAADILYIFTDKKNYYADQKNDYIELKDVDTNKRVGYIILNYDKHSKDKSITKMPWNGVDFLGEIAPAIKKYIDENYD